MAVSRSKTKAEKKAPSKPNRTGRPPGVKRPDTLLAGVTGSTTAEGILLFLAINASGHSAEIAAVLGCSQGQVYRQLRRFEDCGVLERTNVGPLGVFAFSRQPVVSGFVGWIAGLASAMTDNERAAFRARRKARASGKTLKWGAQDPQEGGR
jgi:hypothetical protein